MIRWLLLVLFLAGPALAQTLDAPGSKAGIPFSPTQQWGYSTATYAPPGGYAQPTYGYYGYGGGGYYYSGGYGNGYGDYSGNGYNGSYGYPGSYSNPYGRAPVTISPGRSFPSAKDESRLHEIRR